MKLLMSGLLMAIVSMAPAASAQGLFASCKDAENYAFNQANQFGRAALDGIRCDASRQEWVLTKLSDLNERFLLNVMESGEHKACAHSSFYASLIDVIREKFQGCASQGVAEFNCLKPEYLGRLVGGTVKQLERDLGPAAARPVGQRTFARLDAFVCGASSNPQAARDACWNAMKAVYGPTVSSFFQESYNQVCNF
ncbi:MAG TPA: hypothetical protein VFO10_10500 [Oligoflexus sp.]|uniref:hypothetical protein n=1 Tax=Oligoflexus sp. TaxID=1971216 RepID=UPI002D7EB9B7|nr:hypothetical protein [Oligoflexus sp.]HET9237673.1 hypothetical protein [Oligoflexus sp.]